MIHLLTSKEHLVKKLKTKDNTNYTIRFTKDEIINLVDGLNSIRKINKSKETKLETDLFNLLLER